jgi:uncharacterized protein (TIGR00369 family)
VNDVNANHCFGCGPANPQGLHLVFDTRTAEDGTLTATATVELTRLYEGPPGHIHGGILATLFDEAMSKLNRPLQAAAMTRHLEVEYLRPAPLETPLQLTSRHLRREGRKLFHTAELTGPDGRLLAAAKGLFIVVDRAPQAAGSFSPAPA